MGMLLFAKTLGSVICFCVARNIISESRKRSILANPTICKVNRVLSTSPVYYGTLCRLATMPTVVKNYGLALLDIRFPDYMVREQVSQSSFIILSIIMQLILINYLV